MSDCIRGKLYGGYAALTPTPAPVRCVSVPKGECVEMCNRPCTGLACTEPLGVSTPDAAGATPDPAAAATGAAATGSMNATVLRGMDGVAAGLDDAAAA